MLEKYRQQKEKVSAVLVQLGELSGELGMCSLQKMITSERLPKLEQGRFNLVVVGEFNHGKSTFVNALLGEDLLPTGITPTTATINHIVWAEKPQALAVLSDGKQRDVELKDLAAYVTLAGAQAEHTRYLEIGYPVELLRDQVTLVDTPGVNDINEARAEITYGYIPRADAVVFLLDATQVLKKSERVFLQQRLLKRSRDKLVFVLGKADLLDEAELEEAKSFCEQHLAALVDDPVIFPASPRQCVEGQREQSGMLPLIEYLKRYLTEERGRILVDNAVADASHTAEYLRSSIGLKRGSLKLSLEELSERVAQVREQLEGSRKKIRTYLKLIDDECAAIKGTMRHDLREFVDEFCDVLPAQIDKADAAEVKKYLQFFIQDKFKQWAELEGEKLSQLLEELAEEIIQVTNENVRSVLESVSGSLGPEKTKVVLDVDTLKYDASIFALGALGTAVFLFVNTFVGGLLALAAPVLAVVLKEKMGARIKAQAKTQGPLVIRRAADAMQPKFEEVVDQFAERLAEFITSAGEALHRGIEEVLDRTLAQRKEKSDDVEKIDAELDGQEKKLEQIVGKLTQLRGGLWGRAKETEDVRAR